MSTFNKFNSWVQYMLNGGNPNFTSDVCKLMLTNTAPVATNTTYASISANELASGNGYTTGGAVVTSPTSTNASGVQTVSGTIANPTWTATGNLGPFRYPVYYDSTMPGAPLIGWWDYGSSLTLTSGQSFQLSNASGFFQVS